MARAWRTLKVRRQIPRFKSENSHRRSGQGCSKVAAKPLGMRKFSGFLPKATTTLERPCKAELPGDVIIQNGMEKIT
jgi:hypothetical protein